MRKEGNKENISSKISIGPELRQRPRCLCEGDQMRGREEAGVYCCLYRRANVPN